MGDFLREYRIGDDGGRAGNGGGGVFGRISGFLIILMHGGLPAYGQRTFLRRRLGEGP